jgi:hypothetical protein|tara:strand:- start:81211 stop:81978 length:768 start_codon:yes stop_codon:yes gene_type:complete
MRVKKFKQYNKDLIILDDFLKNSGNSINESDKGSIDKIIKSILNDLGINLKFVSTFGFAISGLYPIVESLMKNMKLTSVELTPNNIVMITLTAVSVIFLEERELRLSDKEKLKLEKETKSLLTELKLNGIGNGIIKKLTESLKSIKNLVNIILKHSGKAIESVVDMFAYTSLLIPVLNSVNFIVGKYDLTMDMLVYNLSGIAMGVLTIIVKHGVKEILKRLAIKKVQKEEIIDNIEDEFDDIDNDPSIHNLNDNI